MIVLKVNGFATAAGCQLVATCDMIVCSDTSKFSTPGGLVTKVVPATDLDAEVEKIVDKIKHKSRSVITLGKQFFYKQIDLSLFEAYKLGSDVM
ncbi:Enoyl-CoA hydratase domain-containing protein 3, partial [Operophtera brumata]